MSEEKTVITTPMDERQLSALDFIKFHMGNGPDFRVGNVDAVRRAVIEYARSIGWKDLQQPPASADQEQPGKKGKQ